MPNRLISSSRPVSAGGGVPAPGRYGLVSSSIGSMDLTQSYETYGISGKGRSRRHGNDVLDAHSSDDLTIGCAGDTLKLMLNQSTLMDRVFQALADPSRRGMVDRLCQG